MSQKLAEDVKLRRAIRRTIELRKNYLDKPERERYRQIISVFFEKFILCEVGTKKHYFPNSDCVMAMFSIPFCNKEYFDELWNKIYDSLNNNGYFVGQLFGDRDAWKDSDWVNTFSKNDVLVKLKKYELLLFDEIEYVREQDNKKWHYFNIIARKKN